MERMGFAGFAVRSHCGGSVSGIIYEIKKEADEHCKEWNLDERLGDFRPYRVVELFYKDEQS